jgi:hypothetical protein
MKKIYSLFSGILLFGTTAISQTVIPPSDELILPQYAYYGGVVTNPASASGIANRLPFVCRLKLTGLTASATYRYFAGVSNNATITSSQAPGNMYRINNVSNTFGFITGFSTSKSMNAVEIADDLLVSTGSGRQGRFTAEADGTYIGWFSCVPIGTAAASGQHALGNDVYVYVNLNDGISGTAVARSFRTTSTVKLLDYSNLSTGCTALLGSSTDIGSEKAVTIYDNTGSTGRPLYCTFTENNNSGGGTLNEATIWSNPQIYGMVDGVSGSWAAIIPNNLSTGVRAINVLNFSDASTIITSPNTSSDGVWGGVSTVNPAGDSTNSIKLGTILLPVNLLSFGGSISRNSIRLNWSTANENKNKYFEILRAGTDGRFSGIGKVQAVATPSITNNYEFFDINPINGKNLYQLKQVDLDGVSVTSRIISIDLQRANNKIKVVSQNPTELTINISSDIATTGSLLYTDAIGRVLYSKQVILSAGENTIKLPVATVALQMGILSLSTANGELVQLKMMR